ncbi:MAG TPA: trimeric intracellular cation channel family protein [Abditibacteriaceae bacterium]|jgi:uncharacterized membrane protein YeiH
MLSFLDWFGTIVFAVSGALAAGRKSLDVFGTVVVAFVTAVGGGTLRDLFLGLAPVFWVRQPAYVGVPIITALITFFLMARVRFPHRTLLVCDAIGLGVFAVAGCQRALEVTPNFIIAVMMGSISGVAGGAIRDLLCGDVPTILRTEIYATAALAGAALFYVLWRIGAPDGASLAAGALLTICLRLAAIRFKAALPIAELRQK